MVPCEGAGERGEGRARRSFHSLLEPCSPPGRSGWPTERNRQGPQTVSEPAEGIMTPDSTLVKDGTEQGRGGFRHPTAVRAGRPRNRPGIVGVRRRVSCTPSLSCRGLIKATPAIGSAALHKKLGPALHGLEQTIQQVLAETPRASSIVENLNSRLRSYFFSVYQFPLFAPTACRRSGTVRPIPRSGRPAPLWRWRPAGASGRWRRIPSDA